jgi:hypothetical protein
MARLLWRVQRHEEREYTFNQLHPLVNRLRACATDEGRWNMYKYMCTLGTEEDLYAVVHYVHAETLEYKLQPGEEVYPSGTDWLSAYMRWARNGNAPLAYHFWAGITILGAVCQRRIWLPGPKKIFLNFYTILGGLRAAGKGQALDPAEKILHLVNEILGEGQPDGNPPPSQRVNLLPADATVEAAITMLSGGYDVDPADDEETPEQRQHRLRARRVDATGVFLLDELATFFGRDTFNSTKRPAWLTTIKECDKYVKVTKGSGVEELDNVAVSMLACCAPDWFQHTIETDMWGSGFMDRCTWIHRDPVWERKEQWNILNAPVRDPAEGQRLAQWLVDNIISLRRKVPAQISPGASKILCKEYVTKLDRERDAFSRFGADAEGNSSDRLLSQMIQVSILLAVSDGDLHPVRVEKRHAELAQKLLMIEERSLVEFMDTATRDRGVLKDKKILAWLESQGGCAPLTLVNVEFRKKIGSTAVVAVHLKNLLDQGLVEIALIGRRKFYRTKGHDCAKCGTGGNE